LIYSNYTQEELDRQYDAASTVPSLAPFVEAWTAQSAATRGRLRNERIAYGAGEREWLDAFPATAGSGDAPLFVFVHGGYWRRLDAGVFSFVAGPVVDAGGACAVVNYPLAPAASLDEIVASVRAAFAWIGENAARLGASGRRIVAGGHSAGGQLAGMLAATDWTARGLADDAVGGVLGLSGLYDLGPIRLSNVNDWLRLDDAAAERNGPIAHLPRRPMPVLAAAGALESDEFKRQSKAYADACAGAGCAARYVAAPEHNHYTIVGELASPETELSRALAAMLRI
jgi:arylformamidase